MRAGILTSEFILTVLLLVGAGLAFGFGRITWAEATTFSSVALAVGGYSIARGIAKAGGNGSLGESAAQLAQEKASDPAPKPPSSTTGGLPFILLPMLLIAAQGCSWERMARISLDTANEVAKAGETTAIPAVFALELAAGKKCGAQVPIPATCPDKDKWQGVRLKLETAVVILTKAILIGRTALLLGAEGAAKKLVTKILALVSELKMQISLSGVLQ